ncbi:hypothetical protein UY3_12598 [Chelonia mydas]|uniref:Uncharacterized protein n=1 Tax=Chelonia mydas TaxID=8469 RepID=M7BDQ3_CHEMY|nr:hypothetical protein UY3_12598 [Chelonia mydas]
MSCQFYKELDAILGGNPTSTAKAPVDTSVARVPIESGPSQEEEILDEDVEREGTQRQRMIRTTEMHAARSSFLTRRRLASHSCRMLVKCKQERRPLFGPAEAQHPLHCTPKEKDGYDPWTYTNL